MPAPAHSRPRLLGSKLPQTHQSTPPLRYFLAPCLSDTPASLLHAFSGCLVERWERTGRFSVASSQGQQGSRGDSGRGINAPGESDSGVRMDVRAHSITPLFLLAHFLSDPLESSPTFRMQFETTVLFNTTSFPKEIQSMTVQPLLGAPPRSFFSFLLCCFFFPFHPSFILSFVLSLSFSHSFFLSFFHSFLFSLHSFFHSFFPTFFHSLLSSSSFFSCSAAFS